MSRTPVSGPVTDRDGVDVTDPMSRHNLHVTQQEDLIDIGPWSQEQLWAAVQRADAGDDIVVLDYGRKQLYLVDDDDVAYLPPSALGLADEAGLQARDPRTYDPERDAVAKARVESVTVAPEFDMLIPAFGWTEIDDNWEPPELDYQERPSGSPSGAVGG